MCKFILYMLFEPIFNWLCIPEQRDEFIRIGIEEYGMGHTELAELWIEKGWMVCVVGPKAWLRKNFDDYCMCESCT